MASGQNYGVALNNDSNSVKTPAEYNASTDQWEMNVNLIGNVLVEQKTQAEAVANVLTFSANIYAIEIYHEEETWQSFTVNGITINVPAGGYRTPVGGTPAATVTIPANINCIVGRLV